MERDNPFRAEQRFVGAYVPPPLADYLRLLGVKENKSTSTLLQEMLELRQKTEPTEEVIKTLLEQAINEFNRRMENQPEGIMKKRAYVKEVERGLRKKKAADEHITTLIEQIQDRI